MSGVFIEVRKIDFEGYMNATKCVAVILIIPVVLVVGIFIRNKSIGPVGWAKDDVEESLRAQMKDPSSMVIRSSYVVVRASGAQTEISICGLVDGRNSLGGYVGDIRFASRSVSNKEVGTFETYSVKLEDLEQTFEARSVKMLSAFEHVYWNNWCVDEHHPALAVED